MSWASSQSCWARCASSSPEGHNAELWDETARRFEHVMPLELALLPEDSMLREFYGGAVK